MNQTIPKLDCNPTRIIAIAPLAISLIAPLFCSPIARNLGFSPHDFLHAIMLTSSCLNLIAMMFVVHNGFVRRLRCDPILPSQFLAFGTSIAIVSAILLCGTGLYPFAEVVLAAFNLAAFLTWKAVKLQGSQINHYIVEEACFLAVTCWLLLVGFLAIENHEFWHLGTFYGAHVVVISRSAFELTFGTTRQ